MLSNANPSNADANLAIKNKFEQLNETVNDNHVASINNLTKKAFCSSQISVLERRKINDMNFVFFLFITL